ncbi:MAG: acyl-CoA dehydrogenase family protein [Qingshengfaniella sp.]
MSQDHIDRTLALLARTPGWAALQTSRDDCDTETVAAVLDTANGFAQTELADLGARADRQGCRLEQGRVRVPDGYGAAWQACAQNGWIALDLPEDVGGSGLPHTVYAAAMPLFERHATPFMMGVGATRSAAHMLKAQAAPDLAAQWVPRLASGDWAATICISEPGAGSDVGRIRSRATRDGDIWRVTGEKIWISFGDHDMAERIGHCLLARTGDAPGTRGLSLFLVPSTRADGTPNGVSVVRIEEKLGMHGSPTCAMAFEDAEAHLIGEENRGLPQLFTMIELMRLQTGCQGLGLATLACEIAEGYAQERLQGGRPDAPPVPIASHPDVHRMLSGMRARTEALRAAILELSTLLDLSRQTGPKSDEAALVAFLLPLVKNFGGAEGFETANDAIQVLGGAGYTQEWPVERALRDARVLTIYEGTTGIQALDLLTRRVWANRHGLDLFLARATAETADHPAAAAVIAGYAALAEDVAAQPHTEDALAGAEAFLRATWFAVCAWMGTRLDPQEARPLYAAAAARLALLRAEALPDSA